MIGARVKQFWKSLGPGLITGAADDDPSAIATYAIAGAQFGTAGLWVLFYVLPFMIAIQKMCARIGALSGHGLAANIKQHYPRWLLALTAVSLVSANVFNIGADIYGMAGALSLVLPLNIQLLAVGMGILMLAIVIFLRHRQIERIFKWFALSLFVYGIALVLVKPDWLNLLSHTLIPHIPSSEEFLIVIFAMLGTTISPYIFFWQASEEAEEVGSHRSRLRRGKYPVVRSGMLAHVDRDTVIGMMTSNLISFFIMGLTATVVFQSGTLQLASLRDAAEILAPLAGHYAFWLFALGLVGSGFLAIPVLAGSAAYVVAEFMGWPASLDKPFNRARQFYIVIVTAVMLGVLMPLFGISPIQALFWTAIINGAIAPILIAIIIHMAHNPAIVGNYQIHWPSYLLGLGAFFLMLTGTIFMVIS